MILFSISDVDDLYNVEYFEFVLEFEFVLVVQFFEIKFILIQSLKEEIFALLLFEKVVDRPVEYFLDYLKSVGRLLAEQVGIDAPVLQLHVQHVLVALLLLVQLPAISDEIQH